MLTIPAELAHSVDAVRSVGHRGGQIGEHRSRGVNPRAAVGIGQHRRDLRGQPGQIGQFPQQPHPGVRHHATAIGRDFHP